MQARGIRHAYVVFPGERHGFRKAESIRTALDGELYFYARVFGFEVDGGACGCRDRRVAWRPSMSEASMSETEENARDHRAAS